MNQPQSMTLQATLESPLDGNGDKNSGKNSASLSDRFSWPGRIVLLLIVVLSPWAFASVGHWAQKWIAVGLLFAMAFWWFETAFKSRSKQIVPYIAGLVFLGILIGILQTISLPDWAADLMTGRQRDIYAEFTGDADAKVSLSLDRQGTWGQIRLLMIALTGLLMGCRYFRTKRDIVLLMTVITANGTAIAFFGIIQKLTFNRKMYWVYELLSGGSPFGPFVNRNNGGGYLLMCLACAIGLFPILMKAKKGRGPRPIISKEIPFWRQIYIQSMQFIAELTAPKLALIFATVVIAAAIPTTLSRGAVVALLVASIGTILLYGMARKPKNSIFILIPLVGFALTLAGWIGFGDELMYRFDQIDMVDVAEADGRIEHWKDTWPAVRKMGWFGSGLGSYKGVHRLYRTSKETAVFAYAENQFFQAVVEAGWPGLIIFLLAWLLAFRYATLALFDGSSSTTIAVGTMGVFLLFSQAVASMFDFGFYIPANLLLLSVLVGFLAYHAQSLAGRLKSKSWLEFMMPNYIVQVLILMLFAGTTMVALEYHRRAGLDSLMRPRAVHIDRKNMDLIKTDKRIVALSGKIQRTPTVEALNYLGELWMHRSRLTMFEALVEKQDVKSQLSLKGPEDQEKQLKDLWAVTDVLQLQETAFYLKKAGFRNEVRRFLGASPIVDNLPSARSYFALSRQISPLQPLVHLRIGEIKGVVYRPGAGDIDIERALELAPSNPSFRKVAGVYYLQSGNVEGSVLHFRRYLELAPLQFRTLMNLVTGRTNRSMERVDDATINRIIPDNSAMLYEYVVNYMDPDSELRDSFLNRAIEVIENEEHSRREFDILSGDIQVELGDLDEAVEQYSRAMTSQPNDPQTRYKRAKLHVVLGSLDKALKDAEHLKRHAPSNATYNKFLKSIESAIYKIEHRD